MIEIKDLLLKLDNLLVSEEIKKQSICDAIVSTTKIKLSLGDIKIKNNIVYLNIRPIYKNEVFIKKDLINSKIKEFLGEKAPRDFR